MLASCAPVHGHVQSCWMKGRALGAQVARDAHKRSMLEHEEAVLLDLQERRLDHDEHMPSRQHCTSHGIATRRRALAA